MEEGKGHKGEKEKTLQEGVFHKVDGELTRFPTIRGKLLTTGVFHKVQPRSQETGQNGSTSHNLREDFSS